MKALLGIFGLAIAIGAAQSRADVGKSQIGGSPFPINGHPAIFDSEEMARSHCPKDEVVWLELTTGAYLFKTHVLYGRGTGTYVCKKEADAAGDFPGRENLDNAFIAHLIEQWITNFCAVYEPPVGDDSCKPVMDVTYRNGTVLRVEAIVSCGPAFEQAFREGVKLTAFPPIPDTLTNQQIRVRVSEGGGPHSCHMWKS